MLITVLAAGPRDAGPGAYDPGTRRHGGHPRAGGDRLFALLLRLLGDRSEAEDVAQEVMLRAWQGIARFQGRSSFFTWLYRIAVNEANRSLDKRSGRPASVSIDADALRLPASPYDEPSRQAEDSAHCARSGPDQPAAERLQEPPAPGAPEGPGRDRRSGIDHRWWMIWSPSCPPREGAWLADITAPRVASG